MDILCSALSCIEWHELGWIWMNIGGFIGHWLYTVHGHLRWPRHSEIYIMDKEGGIWRGWRWLILSWWEWIENGKYIFSWVFWIFHIECVLVIYIYIFIFIFIFSYYGLFIFGWLVYIYMCMFIIIFLYLSTNLCHGVRVSMF